MTETSLASIFFIISHIKSCVNGLGVSTTSRANAIDCASKDPTKIGKTFSLFFLSIALHNCDLKDDKKSCLHGLESFYFDSLFFNILMFFTGLGSVL